MKRGALVVLAAFALVALFVWARPEPRGPDAYFHIALVQRMLAGHLDRDGLPWLPLTRVGTAWVDHEVAWHACAMPFIAASPLAGAQWFAVVQSTLLCAVVLGVLMRWRAPYAGFLALVTVAGSGVMLIRGASFRPQIAAAALLVLALHAMVERRRVRLFALTWCLTLVHGSFVIVIAFGALWTVLHVLLDLIGVEEVPSEPWREGLATAAGALAGLVLNPYVPASIGFAFWHVGLVARDAAGGLEWQPLTTWEQVGLNGAVLAMAALALVAREWRTPGEAGPRTRAELTFLTLAMLALVTSGLRHRRLTDLWVPVTVIWSGVMLRDTPLGQAERWPARLQLVIGLMLGALTGTLFLHYYELCADRAVEPVTPPYERLAAFFRAQKVAPGERLYHSSWGQFPYLAYYLPEMSFISGLDPAFLSSAREDLAKLSDAIDHGQLDGPSLPMRLAFGARWMLVGQKSEPGLEYMAKQDPLLEQVYDQDGFSIYRLRVEPGAPFTLEGPWLRPGTQVREGALAEGTATSAVLGPKGVLDLPLPLASTGAHQLELAVDADPAVALDVAVDETGLGQVPSPDKLRAPFPVPAVGRGLARLRLRNADPGGRPTSLTVRSLKVAAAP